ncbi:MAG: RsmD family RNA methyltransferase, partial [Acidimicrobiales bacterium]|nr:RsmD family RNA methyltransferase [Acidimicrobiales bacterium]
TGARVLDAFAGSGALGIEALSRGAASAVFVERDRDAAAVVAANLADLGLEDRATVVTAGAEAVLARGDHHDLVLLDPPYDHDGWDGLLAGVAGALAEGGIAVIESDRLVAVPATLAVIRSRTYGGTVVQFATPDGAPS